MREVLLSRSSELGWKGEYLIELLDWVAENRRKKSNIYETYVSMEPEDNGGIRVPLNYASYVLQTTSKELHLGLGRMGRSCQRAFVLVLGDLCGDGKKRTQLLLRFEGDSENQKPLLVTKMVDDRNRYLFILTPTH